MKVIQLLEEQQPIPDGKYLGLQSGYSVAINNYPPFKIETGIRGMNFPVTVIIENGVPNVQRQKHIEGAYFPYDWVNNKVLDRTQFQN